MKIGIVGLGGIFRRGCLPVRAANRHEIDYYFASQNEETKAMLKNDFGFTHFCESLEYLTDVRMDACFIQSATVAHYKLAKQCLEAGIHVFMDKPLSEELEETTELLSLAEDKNLMLMVGFNRRFAPSVAAIKKQQNKRVIYLEKN